MQPPPHELDGAGWSPVSRSTVQAFGIPGLGHQPITAGDTQDLPMIQGIALFTSAFVVIANLVVDLLYGVIDPRVSITQTRV